MGVYFYQMTLPALPDLSTPHDELASVLERLIATRASLQKACQDLDQQIRALEGMCQPRPREHSVPCLFESEPIPPLENLPAPKSWQKQAPTSIVMEATAPALLDPKLEQATLEELNNALSKAFAQISGRHPWAG